jgi:leader peptidase (prepilin peptidase)/N-methyltransferase
VIAAGEPLPSAAVFLVGLVVGSFLNVCIHRLPRGASVVRPRSRCPLCAAPIPARHNIPVLSWILLRGRCARCRHPISARYPAVELLAAATALALWRGLGPGVAFAIATAFAWSMIVLFFTDYDLQLLPDAVTLTGFATGMAVSWFNPFLGAPGWRRAWVAAAGAAVGSGLLWSFGAVYGKLRGVEAMGLGDVKMMAMVGSFVGPFGVLLTIFLASLAGAAVGLLMIPLRGRTLRDTLPFGCFLAPASLAALLGSHGIWDLYWNVILPPP